MPTSLTQTDLANAALVRLGQRRIVSLDEDSEQARLCATAFPRILYEVTSAHDWHCLTTRVLLAQATTGPAFGYTYRYLLPGDAMRVLSTDDATQPYVIEGRYLLTNAASVGIRYLQKTEDVALFDPVLVDTLSTRLSAELAWAIRGQQQMAVSLYEAYQQKLGAARRADGMQGQDLVADVVLRALRKLGVAGAPGQVDLSTAVRLCAESYPGLRKALLRTAEWNFAMTRRLLHPVGVGDGTELVVNGTFNADLTGWTDLDTGTGVSTWAAGQMVLTGGLSGVAWRQQAVPVTEAHGEHVLTFTVSSQPVIVRLGWLPASENIFTDTVFQPGSVSIPFTTNGSTLYVGFRQPHNATCQIDAVSVQLVTATAPVSGYAYQFLLPSGWGGELPFLRALEIDALPETRWRLEGQRILTDEPSVVLRYVADITDESLFDALFAEALGDRIASDNALAILGGDGAGRFAQLAGVRQMEATAVTLQEGGVRLKPNQALTRVRLTTRGSWTLPER